MPDRLSCGGAQRPPSLVGPYDAAGPPGVDASVAVALSAAHGFAAWPDVTPPPPIGVAVVAPECSLGVVRGEGLSKDSDDFGAERGGRSLPRGVPGVPEDGERGDATMRFVISASLFVLAACSTHLEPPAGALIGCQSNSDCPAPLVCSAAASRCVDRADEISPSITALDVRIVDRDPSLARLVTAGAIVEVALSVSEPLLLPPVVALRFASSERAPALVSEDDAGLSFVLRYGVTADDPEGYVDLVASVTDLAGLSTSQQVPQVLRVDQTAPAVADDTVGVFYFPDRQTNPLTTAQAATLGTAVQVVLAVNEPLSAAPVLWARPASGGEPVVLGPSVSAVGTFYTFEFTLGTLVANDGAYTLELAATDLAGNRAPSATSPAMRMLVDTLPPPAPRVDVSGTLVYRRLPWGKSGASPSFSLGAEADAATPSTALAATTVLVLDGADPKTALEIRRVRTNETGAFAALDLGGVDRDFLWVLEVDAAGNESPAVRVRDVVWTASLKGRQPGIDVVNPNAIVVQADALGTLLSGSRREPEDVIKLSSADGDALGVAAERVWRERLSDMPTSLLAAGVVYATTTGSILTFGGVRSGAMDSDLLIWNGEDWRHYVVPGQTPPLRLWPAMAYDGDRDRAVVFGGMNGKASPQGDLWEWTGSSWVTATPAGARPSERAGAAMAYDPVRKQVVMFGGVGIIGAGMNFLAETWAWDGAQWTALCTTSPCQDHVPPARVWSSLTYDAAMGVSVLFGGCDTSGDYCVPRNDTWVWDGAAWSEVTLGPDRPGARFAHGAAFVDESDAAMPGRARTLVFGGCTFRSAMECEGVDHEMWALELTAGTPSVIGQWERLYVYDALALPSPGPAGRNMPVVAYDRARNRLLVTGGALILPKTTPCPATCPEGGSMADKTNACVCDGRWNWSWTATDGWQVVARPPEVVARTRPTCAYAPLAYMGDGRTILFGGQSNSSQSFCDDVWEWDGGAWTFRCGAGAPCGFSGPGKSAPPRFEHTLFRTTLADGLLALGGRLGSYGPCDTGTFDCTTPGWYLQQQAPPLVDRWSSAGTPGPNEPSTRSGVALAYDSTHDEIVAFGGVASSGGPCTGETAPADAGVECLGCDTWILNRAAWTWQKVDLGGRTACDAASPSPRTQAAMAYDPLRQQVVLYGGCSLADETCGQNGGVGAFKAMVDAWIYDPGAKSWQVASASAPPGPRSGASLAIDSTRGRLLLHSGRTDSSADLWEWDGATWHEVPVSAARPLQSEAQPVTYDERRQRLLTMVTTGGLPELWELALEPSTRPSAVVSLAWGGAIDALSPADRDSLAMSSLHVVLDAEGVGYDDDTRTGAAASVPTPHEVRGVRLEGWSRQKQEWVEVAASCDSAIGAGPVVMRHLTPSVGNAADLASGTPLAIVLRVSPCRGAGSSSALPELHVDYIEATVTYRLGP